MSHEVYANNMSIVAKSADGKAICSFPDVCLSPPTPPAGPVPIPYPNTGFASDTTDGSKTVKLKGQEVVLKNKSYFSKSTGDEAATKTLGMGVVSHTIQGKVYFNSWSMDVKIEGENVCRNLDLTTHNHNPPPGNTPPWTYLEKAGAGTALKGCKAEQKAVKDNCKATTFAQNCKNKKCRDAMACILIPKGKDKDYCCPPNNTGDHIIEDHWVRPDGNLLSSFSGIANKPGGEYKGAPTMCVNRSRYSGKHGIAHGTRGVHEDDYMGKPIPYPTAKKIAVESFKDANPDSKCSAACLKKQMDNFYGKSANKNCRASDRQQPLKDAQRKAAKKRKRKLR